MLLLNQIAEPEQGHQIFYAFFILVKVLFYQNYYPFDWQDKQVTRCDLELKYQVSLNCQTDDLQDAPLGSLPESELALTNCSNFLQVAWLNLEILLLRVTQTGLQKYVESEGC